MNPQFIDQIQLELKITPQQIRVTLGLLDEGSTVPFIARYRKEATGDLDEVAITAIRDRFHQLVELEKRREAILKSIVDQKKNTPELEKKINTAVTLAVLEDLYLPYKPKRKTRAGSAKEKGLEPLAEIILKQDNSDIHQLAKTYVDEDKDVATPEDALAGARDIIAERINEDAEIRGQLRKLFVHQGKLSAHVIKGKEAAGIKYRDYYAWEELLIKMPSHRFLAIRRGRDEGFLVVKIIGVEAAALTSIRRRYLKNSQSASGEQMEQALVDGYQRLLNVSLQIETMVDYKKMADAQAIGVFSGNLRELLLAAPLGRKRVLAIDPGFRTGCKVVCLDAQGKLLFNCTIFPTTGSEKQKEAGKVITEVCKKYKIEAIAVGNGTAGRETEAFLRALGLSMPILMVNESGASIYSASEVAREEMPDQDITVRGSVSIGRRLIDPLAELVKIDPKSIGVGQYQHDVNQKELKQSLDDVVLSCVNAVGVDVNTASKQILTYISGLGPKLAINLVEYRNTHGEFASRKEFKKIPKLGDKAFEQAAGFLRISNAGNPLDRTAVHPERYKLVAKMAADLGCQVEDLISEKELRVKIDLQQYSSEAVGLPTLNDIMAELEKPGRDPRKKFEIFSFAEGIHKPADLEPDMILPGLITNVADFGAFVDVGVHQDGLVHISQLCDHFIKDPKEYVKVQQQVKVKVLEVDLQRGRISLTMKGLPQIEGS